MSKYIKCPRCRSTELNVVEDNRNDAVKGLLGYKLTGTLYGAMAFANMEKSVFECVNCGHVFKEVW